MKPTSHTYDAIVVGGGPAGMMAAGRAAQLGARVLLLEKNKNLGKKLGITGGGRCNITHAEYDNRKFLENFPQSKQFLFSPFSQFSVKETFTFFEKLHLPLIVEARERVFPKSQQATDVVKAMERYIKKHNVEIKTNARVVELKKKDDGSFIVTIKGNEVFSTTNVVVATGGYAAPETGSTGDGFSFLKEMGHTIHKPTPNIVPLTSNAKWIHAVSGVSLSFMKISFIQKGKTKIKKIGKILFTHFGISGPLVLNSSYEVKKLLDQGKVEASIDLFPDTEENELDRRVWRLFEQNKNKVLKNVLPDMLPKGLALEILKFPSLQLTDKPVHEITKEERKKLVKKMKNLTFNITGTLGYDNSVVADGGVDLTEVDFKTMTSRIDPHIYLLGDILHINRPSGGYSLQLCWTTGWVAGSTLGKLIIKK